VENANLNAWLVHKSGRLAGTRHSLRDDVTRIGRSAENDVIITDAAIVSGHHVEIRKQGNTYRLSDLNSNAILDRGAIVGLWEYDPASSSIAWLTFAPPDKAVRECVSRTEACVRDQLGDARSFSLDSPKSRWPRIEAIRNAQKHK